MEAKNPNYDGYSPSSHHVVRSSFSTPPPSVTPPYPSNQYPPHQPHPHHYPQPQPQTPSHNHTSLHQTYSHAGSLQSFNSGEDPTSWSHHHHNHMQQPHHTMSQPYYSYPHHPPAHYATSANSNESRNSCPAAYGTGNIKQGPYPPYTGPGPESATAEAEQHDPEMPPINFPPHLAEQRPVPSFDDPRRPSGDVYIYDLSKGEPQNPYTHCPQYFEPVALVLQDSSKIDLYIYPLVMTGDTFKEKKNCFSMEVFTLPCGILPRYHCSELKKLNDRFIGHDMQYAKQKGEERFEKIIKEHRHRNKKAIDTEWELLNFAKKNSLSNKWKTMTKGRADEIPVPEETIQKIKDRHFRSLTEELILFSQLKIKTEVDLYLVVFEAEVSCLFDQSRIEFTAMERERQKIEKCLKEKAKDDYFKNTMTFNKKKNKKRKQQLKDDLEQHATLYATIAKELSVAQDYRVELLRYRQEDLIRRLKEIYNFYGDISNSGKSHPKTVSLERGEKWSPHKHYYDENKN
eukprot:Awhi_evm1s949